MIQRISLYVMAMFLLGTIAVEAQHFKTHRIQIEPLSKTVFRKTDHKTGKSSSVDLKGRDFLVVSVREPGSDGRVYAVDRDGTIWWSGVVSSGAAGGHETSNGIFHVILKRRFHMSHSHPSSNGVNNMDFEIEFTPDGEALHLGNVHAMSHGCIHVGRQDIGALFGWAKVGMPVVVLRGSYKPFLNREVQAFRDDIEMFNSLHY